MADIPKDARQWILTNKPTDMPELTGDNPTFTLKTASLADLKPNQVLLKTLNISNDPAQRGWISANVSPERLYLPPVPLDTPMRSRNIAEVVASTAENLPVGTHVLAPIGWVDFAVLDASEAQPLPPLPAGLNETQYLGSLGMTGLTAYYGLVEVARARPIDRVVVSGAAGATGSMVIQIAKNIIGCRRVVGIAGGKEKCSWVKSLGADECVDYKTASFSKDLAAATDGYVDVFFDNVGGEILDLMLTRMARYGRIAACGAISNYNSESAPRGLGNWFEVVSNRLEIKGFIVLDYLHKRAEVMEVFRDALAKGKIRLDEGSETVVDTGFEGVPKTWMKLFEGGNRGKLVTRLV